jgi:hypothetical protein
MEGLAIVLRMGRMSQGDHEAYATLANERRKRILCMLCMRPWYFPFHQMR